MAVSTSNSVQGANSFQTEIIATADADTVTLTIPHGLSAIPNSAGAPFAGVLPRVTLTPLSAAGRLSSWILTTLNTTGFILTKATPAGSGAAPVQLRVVVEKPHSLVR